MVYHATRPVIMKKIAILPIKPKTLPVPTANMMRAMPRKSSITLALREAAPTSLLKTPRSIITLTVIPMLVAVKSTPPANASLEG